MGWNGMGGKNFLVNVRKHFASCLPVPYHAYTGLLLLRTFRSYQLCACPHATLQSWWGRLGQGRVGALIPSFRLGQAPAAVPQRGWIGLGWGVE